MQKRCLFLVIMSCLASPSSHAQAPLSTELKPKFPLDYYAQQSDRYFNTLDSYASDQPAPKYAKNVIRWEWPPWLKLTGATRNFMRIDWLLTLYPTKVIQRRCRGFSRQPFGRCHVVFKYFGKKTPVPIYEEFSFNDQGEISFIEAWTDTPALSPIQGENDFWAQRPGVKRLSTKVPGLGASGGISDLTALSRLKLTDPDLIDLQKRLKSPVFYWFRELIPFLFSAPSH